MTKADWLDLAPSFIASAVTLVVAFGVWKLTSRREDHRELRSEERNLVAKRLEAYSRLYGSLYVWPNAARNAFTDPTDRAAVAEYEAAMRDVAVDYGLVLMVGSWPMLDQLQEPLNATIDALDGIMARRRSDGDVLPVEQAAADPRGPAFLAAKDMAREVRTALLVQARIDGGTPSGFRRPNP